MTEIPETRYVKNGDVHLAYQVSGSGPVDLLFTGDLMNHLELDWELPACAAFWRRIGTFARVVRINRRGVGLSDRRTIATAIEEEVDDLIAVMDAVTCFRPFVLGSNEGAVRAAVLAAMRPDRVSGLILYAGFAKARHTPDFPAAPEGLVESLIASVEGSWGRGYASQLVTPGADPEVHEWLQRAERFALGPGDAVQLNELMSETDIRSVLPSIVAPTLVLHRRHDPLVPMAQSQYLAEHIPDARLVELDGAMHPMYLGDGGEEVLAELEEFLTGARPAPPTNRALTTVLFTDIVGSTERAAEVGDAAWRECVEEHDRVLADVAAGFGGQVIKSTGDGALAMFDGPARAVRAALAMSPAVEPLGIRLRAGLHTAEVEVLDHDLAGIGVHIAARVCSVADTSQVLVTSTVKELVAGSGLEFDDAGEHDLKGVPEPWHLYAVRSVG